MSPRGNLHAICIICFHGNSTLHFSHNFVFYARLLQFLPRQCVNCLLRVLLIPIGIPLIIPARWTSTLVSWWSVKCGWSQRWAAMKFHLVHGSTESESGSCQTDELSLSFSAVTDSFWRSTHQLKHMTTSDNRTELTFNGLQGSSSWVKFI